MKIFPLCDKLVISRLFSNVCRNIAKFLIFLKMCVVLNFFWRLTEVCIIFRVDEISSSRVQGAQADRTAQRYLTLNSREKRVKKTRICVQFFQTHGKKRARKKLIGMSKAVFCFILCLTLNWVVLFSWILNVNLKVRLSETIFLLSEILSDSLSSKLNLTPLTVNTAP